MSTGLLFLIVSIAILLLLIMVLKFKTNPFLALLIVSIFTGLASGLPADEVLKSVQNGMGGILGFVAIIVGVGAIFGQILEDSGGAKSMAKFLLKKFGQEKAPWALVLTGFLISIPVFLDVGFIILVPIVYSLARNSKRSLLYYAIPLLAGLAVTHAFIPPTPGPVAVSEIIGADLGWVILFGVITGVPTAIIAGPYFGKYIAKKINIEVPDLHFEEDENISLPPFYLIGTLIGLPLILILVSTTLGTLVNQEIITQNSFIDVMQFLGHPFVALILVTMLSLYVLGTRRGFSNDQLLKLSSKALGPAGLIILITGAGGVFKQILIDSGIGEAIADTVSDMNISLLVLGYILAVIIRVTQGSATVAMITAAGMLSPILILTEVSEIQKALLVLSIAAGSTILSHVNDSGFWLVGKYLGMTEKQTLKSWTVMETIISVVGFSIILLLSLFF
ncbi:MAG: gluconate transporter [Bacteroidetes bacterium]|nr:gluconate transporter [Bacteroidota bacterium]